MSVSEHPDSKQVVMLARLAFLDTGAGVARVRFYSSARGLVTDAATGLLVELPLLDPVGTVTAGVLTLSPGAAALNEATGTVLWARVVNGNGDTAFDCSVSDTAGTGDIKIQSTSLYLGGETRMVSGVLR
ncbi:MAG: hypothetical protein ABJA84_00045 [Polaromonas sp.]